MILSNSKLYSTLQIITSNPVGERHKGKWKLGELKDLPFCERRLWIVINPWYCYKNIGLKATGEDRSGPWCPHLSKYKKITPDPPSMQANENANHSRAKGQTRAERVPADSETLEAMPAVLPNFPSMMGRSQGCRSPAWGALPVGLLMALLSGSLKGNCRVVSSDLKQSFREFCW